MHRKSAQRMLASRQAFCTCSYPTGGPRVSSIAPLKSSVEAPSWASPLCPSMSAAYPPPEADLEDLHHTAASLTYSWVFLIGSLGWRWEGSEVRDYLPCSPTCGVSAGLLCPSAHFTSLSDSALLSVLPVSRLVNLPFFLVPLLRAVTTHAICSYPSQGTTSSSRLCNITATVLEALHLNHS